MKKYLMALIASILLVSFSSALIVQSVDAPVIVPGQEGRVDITIKNTLGFDIKDVSLVLDFTAIPLAPVDSSEASVDELDEDDKETFSFLVRADSNAKVSDYKVPYTITYRNASSVKKGTISIRVAASPIMTATGILETPVQNMKTKLIIKLVNKGLGEARFVTASLQATGLQVLSEKELYLGSIDSDDFETISFEVIPTSRIPDSTLIVSYQDVETKSFTKSLQIPVTVYSQDDAYAKGIIQKSKAPVYTVGVIVLGLIWFIYRFFAKRRRLARAQQRGI